MTTQTYATANDVEDRWRPLSDTERNLADTLAEDASRKARRRWKTLDARISAGTLDPEDVRMVIAGVVKRAMINSATEGVASASDSAGIYSQSRSYANPMGNLYFTAEDDAVLGPTTSRVRSIRLTSVNTD